MADTNHFPIGFHLPFSGKKRSLVLKSVLQNNNNDDNNDDISVIQICLSSPCSPFENKLTEREIKACRDCITGNDFNCIVFCHAPFCLNFAKDSSNPLLKRCIQTAIADVNVGHRMGGHGSVVHVGKHLSTDKKIRNGDDPEWAVNNMFVNIKEVISKTLDGALFILEICAGQGTELLRDLDDFGKFYHRFSDEEKKTKIKVCIDTCHAWASGYKLSSSEDMNNFINIVEKAIGWKYVELIHLNDSKKKCGSRVDRHANLCQGEIWKGDHSGLRVLAKFSRDHNIPMVLETPVDKDDINKVKEINIVRKLLNSGEN